MGDVRGLHLTPSAELAVQLPRVVAEHDSQVWPAEQVVYLRYARSEGNTEPKVDAVDMILEVEAFAAPSTSRQIGSAEFTEPWHMKSLPGNVHCESTRMKTNRLRAVQAMVDTSATPHSPAAAGNVVHDVSFVAIRATHELNCGSKRKEVWGQRGKPADDCRFADVHRGQVSHTAAFIDPEPRNPPYKQ